MKWNECLILVTWQKCQQILVMMKQLWNDLHWHGSNDWRLRRLCMSTVWIHENYPIAFAEWRVESGDPPWDLIGHTINRVSMLMHEPADALLQCKSTIGSEHARTQRLYNIGKNLRVRLCYSHKASKSHPRVRCVILSSGSELPTVIRHGLRNSIMVTWIPPLCFKN